MKDAFFNEAVAPWTRAALGVSLHRLWRKGPEIVVTCTERTPEDKAKLLESLMVRHQFAGDALIEVLHTAQQLYGNLTPPLLRSIAHKLRLPPSRVLGVATFYHLFRFAPRETHTAIVCTGTACYVEGGEGILAAVNRYCDHNAGWTVEPRRCVGCCGLAPIVICDGHTLARVAPANLEFQLGKIHESGRTVPNPAV